LAGAMDMAAAGETRKHKLKNKKRAAKAAFFI
jgi:hypothetical protein